MGRPIKECLSSFYPSISDKIISIRNNNPGWGAKSIYEELENDKYFSNLRLPKISTIALFLKEKGFVKEYERHVPIPNTKLHKAKYAHHIWQIDGQGATEVNGLGRLNLINTKDVFSKAYCGCYPCTARSHNGSPSGIEYQHALRLAFTEFGIPLKVQTDHAAVFFENKGKSPFPTRFHLWLISLGIELILSRKYRPTDQAIVERSHQTLEAQILKGKSFNSMEALHKHCNERRYKLNNTIPCSSTAGKPPLIAFPKADHSNRGYRPETEKINIDLDKVYKYLSQGQWYRKVNKSKTVYLGGQWYYLKQAKAETKVRINFCYKNQQVIFRDIKKHILERQPLKGISKGYLMGESFFKACLPNFQLQLPFDQETLLISTTFLEPG
ncbi:integrase core domain-containing protein [Saprospiraceae bacterium]|nr:integrase core domain-containing protein [Saprospiraceae bacterium]